MRPYQGNLSGENKEKEEITYREKYNKACSFFVIETACFFEIFKCHIKLRKSLEYNGFWRHKNK